MAQKTIIIPEIGEVTLQKRKGARSIRLTIGHDGQVRVSMPTWSPYHVAEAFARSKIDWVKAQQIVKKPSLLMPGDRVGKGHRLHLMHEHRPDITTRITKTEILVRAPFDKKPSDRDVQEQIRKAAIRALKQEGKLLLPGRVDQLARLHGFNYKSVSIKQLKSRWGSCNSHKEIALNCYLMQLPWELIDYVILHELVHTRIMAHGKPFWDELSKYVNNLSSKRKTIREHQPALLPQI